MGRCGGGMRVEDGSGGLGQGRWDTGWLLAPFPSANLAFALSSSGEPSSLSAHSQWIFGSLRLTLAILYPICPPPGRRSRFSTRIPPPHRPVHLRASAEGEKQLI